MKRYTALLLSLLLLFSVLPVQASASSTLKASSSIMDFIKSREGCKLTAYQLEGEQYYTIGYGHYGPDVEKGQTITQARAEELFAQDLKKFENYVNEWNAKYSLELTQNRFDALVSFTYNCGPAWIGKDTWRISQYTRNGFKYSDGTAVPDLEIADAFAAISDGGVGGLVTRRMFEANIFLYGDYGSNSTSHFVCVILNANGGTISSGNRTAIFYKGQPYGKLPDATKSGYKLRGWYSEYYENYITASSVAKENLYLDAVWVKEEITTEYTLTVNEGGGGGKYSPGEKVYINYAPKPGYCFIGWDSGTLQVYYDNASGGYYVIMPYKSVTITALYQEGCIYGTDCPSKRFADVESTHWAHEGIDFCVANKLFIGTGDDTFSPEDPMTRAMIVTVLYRLAGQPQVSGVTMPFTDIGNDYYYKPVLWAINNRIISDDGYGMFHPDDYLTRQEFATMLMRYASYIGYDIDELKNADLSKYIDSGNIRADHRQSMSWAVGAGIIIGTSENTLEPDSGATRAQIATMLLRYVQAYVTV